MTGVSYDIKKDDRDGSDGKGKIDWHALTNIFLLDYEVGITLQSVVDSFNVNTNKWWSWYVHNNMQHISMHIRM